jgi:hypothetical protein
MKLSGSLAVDDIIPPDTVTGTARDTLAELNLVRTELIGQITVPPGTAPHHRADYWLGLLEGTILSLLAVIPGGDGSREGN